MCFAAFLEVKRMKTMSIDIETYSEVNLAKCGVYKYAESPDFEILLFGYAVDGAQYGSSIWPRGKPSRKRFWRPSPMML